MRVIDLMGNLPVHPAKHYKTRRDAEIRSIAIHHSATVEGSPKAFATYHVNAKHWPGIGYTYVVGKDGKVYKCWPLSTMTYHVGKSNRSAVGICLVGNYDVETPPPVQLDAAAALVKQLQAVWSGQLLVKGHRQYPGYSWKSCPGSRFPWQEFLALCKR